jgi:3-hydroxyisobutyrate dehydrogenase-like beta-hydroxyacid dehydrogenase
MKHFVVGLGEIGTAIQRVFRCDGVDKKYVKLPKKVDVLHICIPYSTKFYDIVKTYQITLSPKYTIVHSTVPIGTCDSLNALHAPIRGKHPNLFTSILVFDMFVGGCDSEEIAEEFANYGIHCIPVDNTRDTEALKLWDTTQYGVMILLNKEIHKFCKKHGLDFNVVYSLANETYNEGYLAMKNQQVVRPYLEYIQGEIGGHCVVPNAKMLNSFSAKRILNYKGEENVKTSRKKSRTRKSK